ncbi:MAG: tRNA (adenosine(37)-N6)-threonylcarbamoyltransferase complex transferase subunit TsaD [Firmicutes bacterium]|nr:tRNA (adenosine(37)-N6)-threonylcarbamoyltransferase complex transferase subunit TsaD [Bacillota bacterium]
MPSSCGKTSVRSGAVEQFELVLGIESSCDETAAAVVKNGREVLSNVISSQVQIHQKYGGVVPEVASRNHLERVLPVVDEAVRTAGVSLREVAGVAVTYGPGLVGSLLVGVSVAKALAFALKVPLIGINHIEGHIYANFLAFPELVPPFLCLTVSGGHTALLVIHEPGRYEVLGNTRDDAAGEAFDKVARVLGLGYPGGPEIEKAARRGDPEAFSFPRALQGEDTLDFSFSGLKTAVLNHLNQRRQKTGAASLSQDEVADIAASFQAAIIDSLVEKTVLAMERTGIKQIALSGGVSANMALRERLEAVAKERGAQFFAPPLKYTTDNAAMIASAGYYRLMAGERSEMSLNAIPDLRFSGV